MNSSEILDQVDLIRQVFSYAHRFRNRTFVIHVETGVLEDGRIDTLVGDLVLLHQAGIRIILVPSARCRIDEVLQRYGVESSRVNGVRIASREAIPFVKMAAFDVTNRFMTYLTAHHTNAVVGNWVRARGIGVINGVDFEHAGMVERIQVEMVRTALDQGIVPIFPCIGWSSSGKPYNISSRELAFRIALSMEADKLFFVTDRMAITTENLTLPEDLESGPSGRISRLTVEEAARLLEANGMPRPELTADEPSGYHEGLREHLEYLRLAYLAAGTSVNRVHIVDGSREGVILVEVFSSRGIGTMVHANDYQSIRPMRGGEVGTVYRLMQPLVDKKILVHRDPDDIEARRDDYVVHETDGRIHGCGALHEYANGSGEIAGIAVDPAYEEYGIGRHIVLYLIEEARRRGLHTVFVLTTQTSDWFERIGFVRTGVEALPEEKQRTYNLDRNSIVLQRRLDEIA